MTTNLPAYLAERRERAASRIRGLNGAQILEQAKARAARQATQLVSEGSVKLIMGHYITKEAIDAIRSKPSGS